MNTDRSARDRVWQWCVAALVALVGGCGGDPDDVAEVKTPMALEDVPPAVMKAATEAAPELTFFAAAKGRFEGKDSIELKGKTKAGKIKEVEISPDGKFLGIE